MAIRNWQCRYMVNIWHKTQHEDKHNTNNNNNNTHSFIKYFMHVLLLTDMRIIASLLLSKTHTITQAKGNNKLAVAQVNKCFIISNSIKDNLLAMILLSSADSGFYLNIGKIPRILNVHYCVSSNKYKSAKLNRVSVE